MPRGRIGRGNAHDVAAAPSIGPDLSCQRHVELPRRGGCGLLLQEESSLDGTRSPRITRATVPAIQGTKECLSVRPLACVGHA